MKALKYLAAVVMATAMFSCGQNSKTGQTEADSLRSELELKQKEMDELLSTINFVQDGFDQIDQMEGRIDMAMGDAGTTSDRSRIESQMNFIITRMKENRDKIEQLNKMLRDSKNVSAQTKKTVEMLTRQLQEKEAALVEMQKELEAKNIKIAELDSAVTTLSSRVGDLESDNLNKDKVIDAQDKIVNRAWYVFGTKKELRAHKILDDGEVLQNQDFDKDYFTEIDIREFKELPLQSRRATIETSHPAGSYELTKDSKGYYVLKITDPVRFWEVSRYLVVTVK